MNRPKHLHALVTWFLCLVIFIAIGYLCRPLYMDTSRSPTPPTDNHSIELASNQLQKLPVKESDSGDDYERGQFSSGWASWGKCNIRQKILNRDVKNIKLSPDGCTVISGSLVDPYTGKTIEVTTKSAVSKKIQIDHVVALSNAWRTGAKYLSPQLRKQLANDDLELIAVSSAANQEKSDGDASQWLPKNSAFHCLYIARQIAVKIKYKLWITNSEKSAMSRILSSCPNQPMPVPAN